MVGSICELRSFMKSMHCVMTSASHNGTQDWDALGPSSMPYRFLQILEAVLNNSPLWALDVHRLFDLDPYTSFWSHSAERWPGVPLCDVQSADCKHQLNPHQNCPLLWPFKMSRPCLLFNLVEGCCVGLVFSHLYYFSDGICLPHSDVFPPNMASSSWKVNLGSNPYHLLKLT